MLFYWARTFGILTQSSFIWKQYGRIFFEKNQFSRVNSISVILVLKIFLLRNGTEALKESARNFTFLISMIIEFEQRNQSLVDSEISTTTLSSRFSYLICCTSTSFLQLHVLQLQTLVLNLWRLFILKLKYHIDFFLNKF